MEFKRSNYLNQLISHSHNHMIKVITGIRRCGKSYLLNKIFYNRLVENGVNPSNIIRFGFDFDEDLDKLDDFCPEQPTRVNNEKGELTVNAKKFRAYISSLTKDSSQFYYLLLDEVQLLENFVGTLNGYLNHDNFDVYVTGSNSKFLSSDIATEFRGRGDVIHVQPLTFREYYDGIGGDKRNALFEYLRYGGLPLCALSSTPDAKQNYLTSLYKTIYLADLKQRHHIRRIDEFDTIVMIIASSIGSLVNINKIADTFKSVTQRAIAVTTIKKYMDCMTDAFLIAPVRRFDVKGRRYIGALQKYYFTDPGIRNSILGFRQFEATHLMENLIYNELVNRGFSVDVGIVAKNVTAANGNGAKEYYEVDFVANKGSARYYIQSAYSLPDEDKQKQEEKSLDGIRDGFEKIIITFDDFVSYHKTPKGYTVMNIFEFLDNREYLK